MIYSKGSLLVTQKRITERVINRLRHPTDGDIVVPGGTVSILGTTSERTETPDLVAPEIHEIDRIIEEGTAMLPILGSTRYIRAYCGVRPLLATEDAGDDRTVSRGFSLIDHADIGDRINNLVTITGGKLTTYRLMAEKTADLICRRLGVREPCTTHKEPLPDSDSARWTQPGLAPTLWLRKQDPDDIPLCECELVPKSVLEAVVDAIGKNNDHPSLKAISLRSRMGKGPCQGTFCSQQVTAYLYDREIFQGREGLVQISDFLRERWRGQRVLLWDTPLGQAELLEAMHCGAFGLELEAGPFE
jgi:glycerol-3-phosphate dehydrogenase